jgi:hypothetical protein
MATNYGTVEWGDRLNTHAHARAAYLFQNTRTHALTHTRTRKPITRDLKWHVNNNDTPKAGIAIAMVKPKSNLNLILGLSLGSFVARVFRRSFAFASAQVPRPGLGCQRSMPSDLRVRSDSQVPCQLFQFLIVCLVVHHGIDFALSFFLFLSQKFLDVAFG